MSRLVRRMMIVATASAAIVTPISNVGTAVMVGEISSFLRCCDLLDHVLTEDHHSVGHRQGVFLVKRDQKRCDAKTALQLLELDLELLSQLLFARTEGLIEQ